MGKVGSLAACSTSQIVLSLGTPHGYECGRQALETSFHQPANLLGQSLLLVLADL